MSSLAEIDARVTKLLNKILELHALRLEKLRNTKLRCEKCKKKTELAKWVLRRPAWLLPPMRGKEESRKEKELLESRVVCPCCHAIFRVGDQGKTSQPLIIRGQCVMKQGEDLKI